MRKVFKIFFYRFFRFVSILSRVTRNREIYMFFYQIALKMNGVVFIGKPRFIHFSTVLDTSSDIILGKNVVISINVILLTHDYSLTAGLISLNEKPNTDVAIIDSITIGDNCFIGAGSIILPGVRIGSHVIVGAGSIVKKDIPDYSVVAGNPAKVIGDIRTWTLQKKENLSNYNLFYDKR